MYRWFKRLRRFNKIATASKSNRLEDRLGKQGFHYDAKQLFEPFAKILTDESQKILEETRFNTQANEIEDESNKYIKTLKLLKKTETVCPSLIRSISKLLVPKDKSQFRLDDDSDSDDWNYFKMKNEKLEYTMISYFLETLL